MLIYQDYETLSSWSPVESIVIVSPNFPINSHAVSADLDYVNGFATVISDVRHKKGNHGNINQLTSAIYNI